MDRGQVAIEALAAAVVLVFTFVLVAIYTGLQNEKVSLIESGSAAERECLTISSAISLVEDSQDNSEIIVSVSLDANISGGYVNLQDYYCQVPGSTASGSVQAGEIRVRKEGGAVSVENV